MRTTRRRVLRAGAALGAMTALPGCDLFYTGLARLGDPSPEPFDMSAGPAIDPDFHLLSRATWGPGPGDLAVLRRMGRTAWIEAQLHPEAIDDRPCDLRAAQCESMKDTPEDLFAVRDRYIHRDLVRDRLIRAVHSRRQLHEVMVGFWHDHLSVDAGKQGCTETKPLEERAVIRPHALGRFRDLIRASALSPAMLYSLDGVKNRRRGPDDRPNENYARELLELHTLGVHGGYTQRDVMEAARCLTGWTVRKEFLKGLHVVFRPEWHDDGEKIVLGTRIPAGGGEADLDRLLDVVCGHPSTAHHLAWKLCRRFVADRPPDGLVRSTAERFTQTGGDVREVVRHILTSAQFEAAAGAKVKRPLRFVASALRALDAECRAGSREIEFLTRLGHVPFRCPTPDGYPEEPEPWMGSLLWRWNFALALTTGRLDRTKVDLPALARRAGLDARSGSAADLAPHFFGRTATDDERRAVETFSARGGVPGAGTVAERKAESVALLLCSPGFQVH